MSVPAAWLRCSGSVCERCVCVSGGGDHSQQGGSWDPPETWAHDPEIMRSEAPKQQAWNQTPLPPPSSLSTVTALCSVRSQAMRSVRGQPGEEINVIYIPGTPILFLHLPTTTTTILPFTAQSWYFPPDIDLYFKTTTEPHVPSLSWHKRFVEMGPDIADNWQSPALTPPRPAAHLPHTQLSHPNI